VVARAALALRHVRGPSWTLAFFRGMNASSPASTGAAGCMPHASNAAASAISNQASRMKLEC